MLSARMTVSGWACGGPRHRLAQSQYRAAMARVTQSPASPLNPAALRPPSS